LTRGKKGKKKKDTKAKKGRSEEENFKEKKGGGAPVVRRHFAKKKELQPNLSTKLLGNGRGISRPKEKIRGGKIKKILRGKKRELVVYDQPAA